MRWPRALLIGTALLALVAPLAGCRSCAPVERALRITENQLRETKEELDRQTAINHGLQGELEVPIRRAARPHRRTMPPADPPPEMAPPPPPAKEETLPAPRPLDGPKLDTSNKAKFNQVRRDPVTIPHWADPNDPWRPAAPPA